MHLRNATRRKLTLIGILLTDNVEHFLLSGNEVTRLSAVSLKTFHLRRMLKSHNAARY